jgi:hypothetical protein
LFLCAQAEGAPFPARRGVIALLYTLSHAAWPAWPAAAASCRAASRLAAGALAELRPSAGGAEGRLRGRDAPKTPSPLARECLHLLGYLLSDRATYADVAAELGADAGATQRALAASAAAVDSPDASLRRLGRHVADRVVAHVAAEEGGWHGHGHGSG